MSEPTQGIRSRPRSLPRWLVRTAEVVCVIGLMLSSAAIIAGIVSQTDKGPRLLLGGLAGVLISCFVPVWLVGTHDSVEAGQHATVADLGRWEFGATWGLLAYVAHFVGRWKRGRKGRERSAGRQ